VPAHEAGQFKHHGHTRTIVIGARGIAHGVHGAAVARIQVPADDNHPVVSWVAMQHAHHVFHGYGPVDPPAVRFHRKSVKKHFHAAVAGSGIPLHLALDPPAGCPDAAVGGAGGAQCVACAE